MEFFFRAVLFDFLGIPVNESASPAILICNLQFICSIVQ